MDKKYLKEFTEEQQEIFMKSNDVVAKTLIYTMEMLDIPNYIEFSCRSGDYEYKLRFDKKKIKASILDKVNNELKK